MILVEKAREQNSLNVAISSFKHNGGWPNRESQSIEKK